jgi:peptidase E
MTSPKGFIVLMGSGELTATMVEIHKELLARLPDPAQAVFLDTPAGFQLNADQLSQKAVSYFDSHVRHALEVASLKSVDAVSSFELEQALQTLRSADYILIGPGSPTYAVRQWQQTEMPNIFLNRVQAGGCLVAASAAALTMGPYTLPVYEIYKVGEAPYWYDGMNILGDFGIDLVVVPHWNNAEGGTHDTRFWFMGEKRFRLLESLLPEDVGILGLDEHTACIIDFSKGEAQVKGLGRITLRHRGTEKTFEKGDRFSIDIFRGLDVETREQPGTPEPEAVNSDSIKIQSSFWDAIHAIKSALGKGLEEHDPKATTNALLELDQKIWKATQDLENEEFISQAREILRDHIVLLGIQLGSAPRSTADCLAPLVDELIILREKFRNNKQWADADAIRDCLERARIIIEDARDGTRWRLKS